MEIEAGERAEAHLDALITKRHEARVKDEGERPAEEAWAESERVYFAKRQQEIADQWKDYRRHMRDLHWRLGDEHDAELKKLEEGERFSPLGTHHEERNGHHGD